MKTNGEFKDERDKIVKGLEEAYRRLVVIKKQNNSPLVVSRNGEVTEIGRTTVNCAILLFSALCCCY